jgi:hypothetical protein
MMSSEDEQLVDVRQAATLAGRAPETIRRWVWSGRLPARRRGRKLLVARRDVLRLAGGGGASAISLADWRRMAVKHLRGTQALPGAKGSAADLVLADRRSRESTDLGDDARR